MADKKTGEQPENQTNTQSENFIIPKKKWRSYLLEFLMLFLAVFLGFVAENIRVKNAEQETEKQYMITMVEDLKSDTTRLAGLIVARKNRIIELDSLFNLISSDRYIKEGNKVYGLYYFPYWDVLRFFPSDRTMQQLKNSGNLRLIRKENVSDALIRYDVFIRNRKEYESLQVELANQINPIIEKLIDPIVIHNAHEARYYNEILASDTLIKVSDFRLNLPQNLSISPMDATSKKALLKYIFQITSLYVALRNDNIREKDVATNTLELIVKEYGVE